MAPQSIVVELVDACNLRCPYCLRSEESLRGRAHCLPLLFLRQELERLNRETACRQVTFTGGEPTLHPDLAEIVEFVHQLGWRFTLVTNGWSLARILPSLIRCRTAVEAIVFSLDGIDVQSHDATRGEGSFRRLMASVAACSRHDVPFRFKTTIDRQRSRQIESLVLFAARLGAQSLEIGPLIPTPDVPPRDALDTAEQQDFLRGVNDLRRVVRMPIMLAAGFYDRRAEPTCGPLLGHTRNIDYLGRHTLCTVLASFRGGAGQREVIGGPADSATATDLRRAELIRDHNERREAQFAALDGAPPSLGLGSPCLHCLISFDKVQMKMGAQEPPLSFEPAMRFQAQAHVVASEFDGKEAVLLDTSKQRYHVLNETAAFLWSQVEKQHSLEEMLRAMCATFDVNEDRARRSLVQALAGFEASGLARRSGPALPPREEDR